MTKKSDLFWYQENTRQAPIAILLIIFNVIKSLIRTWWPFILIVIFRSNFITAENGRLLIAGVTLLVILFSIWSYLRFYFYIADDKLHVFKGVFTKVKLDIPFDRIQSITFEQNVVHRLFKVARVKVDTAGSSSEEFEFAALDLRKADELRAFILSRKSEDQAGMVQTEERADRLLLNLEVVDLVKVGISQNHLRTTGIVVAFILGLRDRIEEALGGRYLDRFDSWTDRLFENLLFYGVGLFITILILSFFGTIIYSVFRYYDLKLWKSNDGYKMESGLLNRTEQAARDQKIQIVRWVTNPLRDIFGIVQLRFYQASSGTGNSKTSISVPGVPKPLLLDIVNYYYGSSAQVLEAPLYTIDRSFFRRRFLFMILLPSLGLLSIALSSASYGWYILLFFWFTIGTYFQYNLGKKWRYVIDDDGVLTISGVLERMHKILLLRKVQGVQLRQSPYQRRHGLATVVLHSASGDVTIPYIKFDLALQMKNYILYKVESSKQPWM